MQSRFSGASVSIIDEDASFHKGLRSALRRSGWQMHSHQNFAEFMHDELSLKSQVIVLSAACFNEQCQDWLQSREALIPAQVCLLVLENDNQAELAERNDTIRAATHKSSGYKAIGREIENLLAWKNLAKLNPQQQGALLGAGASSHQAYIKFIGGLLELADPHSQGHGARVAKCAKFIATRCKCSNAEVHAAYNAGLLHRIGRLGLPQEAMRRNLNQLDEVENLLFKQHAHMAATLLSELPDMELVVPAIRNHREYLDGSGFPQGLKAADIGVLAQILGLAVDFENYRNGFFDGEVRSATQAFEKMSEFQGARYHPGLLKHLSKWVEQENNKEDRALVRTVVTEELLPGMELAIDLKTPSGFVLLKKQSLIDSMSIFRIQQLEHELGVRISAKVYA